MKNEFLDLKNIILDAQIVLQIDHQAEILNILIWTPFWPPSWILTTILFFHKIKNAGNEFFDLTNVILVLRLHKNHVTQESCYTRIMFLSDLQAEILQIIFWTPSWTPSWISDKAPVRFWPILSKINEECMLNISSNFQLAPNFFWVTVTFFANLTGLFTNQPDTLRPNTRLVQAYFLPRTEHLHHIGKATISSVLEEPSFDNNFCYTLTDTTSADDLVNITEDELWTRLAALKIDFQKCSLQPEQKIILARLILRNSDLFAKHSFDIGECPYIQHDIQLNPNAKPFYQRNYPHSPEVKQIIHDQVQTYLKAGIVEESDSFFNSNLLAIRKPSGQHRIVADMRHLNKLSILPIHQPLPIADDILRGIAQSKPSLFTTIDINQAYMHVKLTENARPLTAFSCSGQQKYHYTRMIPGLAGATQTFQRLGERILAGINHLYATSYLDDFIIFSQTFEDHINHLTDVLYRLRRAKSQNFTIKMHLGCTRNQISRIYY